MREENRLSKWTKDIAGSAVFEAVKAIIIFAAFSLISIVGSDWVSKAVRALNTYRSHLIAIGILSSLFVSIWAFQRFSKRKPHFPRLDCDWEVLEKHIHYEYRSPEKIIYKRRFKLRSLKNGLNRYTDKYRWSGANSGIAIKSTNPAHRIELLPDPSLYQFYDICFERPFRRHEIVEAETVWDLQDKERLSRPFVSATVHEPTSLLTFKVFLPDTLGIKQAVRFHSPDIGSPKHINSETVQFIDGWTHWELRPPELKLLHHYEIRWNWNNSHEQKENH